MTENTKLAANTAAITASGAANSLMPCPFCGGTPMLVEHEAHTHSGALKSFLPDLPDHTGSWTIECCDVGMIKDTREDVITAWNRRAAPQPQGGALTDEQIRAIAVNYGRFVFPGVYAITEFDCEEDFFNCVRTILAQSAPPAPQQAGDGLTAKIAALYEPTTKDLQLGKLGVVRGGEFHQYPNGSGQSQTAMFTGAESISTEERDANAAFYVGIHALVPEILSALLAAPRQPGEMGAGVQDEREACPQCNGQRWIFRGNGEDTECEACIVEGWPADESALNEAVEVLRDMLETRNEEAKAEHAYKVAEENYTSSKREFDILTMTMSAAAKAEQRARCFLAKVKAGKHDSTAQQVQADAGAVAKDAERYRWLRDENIVMADDQRSLNVVMGRLPFREDQKDEDLFGNDLDEAIDAAMSREQSGGERG